MTTKEIPGRDRVKSAQIAPLERSVVSCAGLEQGQVALDSYHNGWWPIAHCSLALIRKLFQPGLLVLKLSDESNPKQNSRRRPVYGVLRSTGHTQK